MFRWFGLHKIFPNAWTIIVFFILVFITLGIICANVAWLVAALRAPSTADTGAIAFIGLFTVVVSFIVGIATAIWFDIRN